MKSDPRNQTTSKQGLVILTDRQSSLWTLQTICAEMNSCRQTDKMIDGRGNYRP